MTTRATFIGLALLASGMGAPAAAQTRPPAARQEHFFIAGIGLVTGQRFAAQTTFDAIFGQTFAPFFGGGVEVGEGPYFVDFTVSRFKKTGERAFLFNGNVFQLGIPLTATITPVEVSFGYRFHRRSKIVPYAAGGVGSYGYSESSKFSISGEDVSVRHAGVLVMGGAEFRVHRLVGVAGDVEYTHVPGIIGKAGLSKDAGESDLGGVAVRLKVVVGIRR